MAYEPYIVFGSIIAIVLGVLAFYFSWKKFELLIVLFTLSSWVASAFYANAAEWISDVIATGPGGYIRGVMLLFVGLLGLITYIKRIPEHKGKISIHLIVLFLFLLFSFASTFYSIDSSTTFIRTSLFIALFFFLLGLSSWLDSEENFKILMNTLFNVIVFLLVVNLIALFVWPSRAWWWNTSSRLIGLWSHPNELGGFSMIAYPIILWKLYATKGNAKYLVYVTLGINFLLHVLSGSRTSLLASAVGIIFWLVLQRSWVKLFALTFIFVIGGFVVTQLSLASFGRDDGTSLFQLSERDIIWEGAIILAKEKPIIGYGYAVESKIFANQNKFETEGTFLNLNSQQPLHNGFLSIFVGGGMIGFFLWMIAIGLPILFAFTSKFSLYKIYAIATMIPILISNIVESAITGYLSPTDVFFWIAWVVAGKLFVLENKTEVPTKSIMDSNIFITPKDIAPNV
ncbi:MAG: O-antigen ligase family protein [Melioribacteraceae bacterium]